VDATAERAWMAIKPMEAKCNILPLSNKLSEKTCLQIKTTELVFQKDGSSRPGLIHILISASPVYLSEENPRVYS
jgi:hypothetical protein